jgi:delta14-sterol reductase
MNLAVGGAAVIGFVVFLFLLTMIVPGPKRKGAVLEDGSRKTYVLNGLALFLITAASLAAGQYFELFSLSLLYRHFWGLFVAANVLSIGMTLALYVQGKKSGDVDVRPSGHGTATAEASGSIVDVLKDMWYGVELNPAWLNVDVKLFSYKPSLIGLAVLNASFAVVQYEQHGHLTTQMICYQAFTFIYVFNYFQFEYGMLYTWDIVAEKFGFMLVWGDYAFVPFMYSIVGWYLCDQTVDIPIWAAVLLSITFAMGLWIFRGANQQKDEFKRDPKVKIWGKPAQTLGGKILVSGFWGIGRKLNYTGEIMVYASFTLLSGFDSFVPYLLPTWLICLLVHRAWRDDKRCREKYGALWEQYCRRATFKMFPFVY